MDCPVCGNNMSVVKTDIHKCDICSHVYVNYYDDGLLYHKNEYRTNNNGNRTGNEVVDGKFTSAFHKARKRIMDDRCDFISEFTEECSSMLDIGAGGGTFVNTIRSGSLIDNIECQEISNLCVNNLRRYGYTTYHNDINAINFTKSYDLVTCWHVLEHIKDIHSFVTTVDKITNKYLILEVPVDRSLRPPNDGRWDGHYHFFTEESILRLFEKSNFTKVSVNKPGIQPPSITVIFKK